MASEGPQSGTKMFSMPVSGRISPRTLTGRSADEVQENGSGEVEDVEVDVVETEVPMDDVESSCNGSR